MRRATTDHTDSTDKKTDEDCFESARRRNGELNPLPWNLSLLFIRVIGAAFVRGRKPLIRGSLSFRVTNVTIVA